MKKIIFLFSLIVLSIYCFAQSRHISETTKKIVYARDGGRCQCCGSTLNLEYDHIQPFSCGGSSESYNVQLLCLPCNRSKSNSCTCKIHDRTVGRNCCSGNAGSKSPGSASEAPSRQCSGITKKGSRCKNYTTSASGRCHYHD